MRAPLQLQHKTSIKSSKKVSELQTCQRPFEEPYYGAAIHTTASKSDLETQLNLATRFGHQISQLQTSQILALVTQLKSNQTVPIQKQGYGYEDEEQMMSVWHDDSVAGMTSPDAPMSVSAPATSSSSTSKSNRRTKRTSTNTSASSPTSVSNNSSPTVLEEALQQSLPEDERHLFSSELGTDPATPTVLEEALQQSLPEDERHLLDSDPAVEANLLQHSGLIKPYRDVMRLGEERIRYAVRAKVMEQQLLRDLKAGRIEPEMAKQKAIDFRRQLEAQTRARLPETPGRLLNDMAARRNMAKYGDPLGYRNLEHYHQHKPNATAEQTIRSAGRTNARVTGAGVVTGAVGALGGVHAVKDFADMLAGRQQVSLKGQNSKDYELGYEFKPIHLGNGWYATIRVEKNIFGKKRFYIVDQFQMA